MNLRNDIINCIIAELKIQKAYLQEPIKTIYFGGGTPSLLDTTELQEILNTITQYYSVIDDPEITLEANPDDLDRDKLKSLYESGINRLSIGVQSFDEKILKFLNRAHTQQQAEACIKIAGEIGFKNLTIDLIYGIPGRDHKLWLKDIQHLLQYKPNHISAYCLTIEPQTAFGNWVKKGKFSAVSEDFAADQFEILINKLEYEGYEQYEISNFCLNQQYSKHNTAYWQKTPYLGVGPSAHSYNLKSRQWNISNNSKYIKSLKNGIIPFELENLSIIDRLNDYLLTGLRTKWGISLEEFNAENQLDEDYLMKLQENGKAFIRNNRLILTKEGRFIADQITGDLFIE